MIMTGFGTVETAIEAMKKGAYDYILKPFKVEEVIHVVQRGLETPAPAAENIRLREALSHLQGERGDRAVARPRDTSSTSCWTPRSTRSRPTSRRCTCATRATGHFEERHAQGRPARRADVPPPALDLVEVLPRRSGGPPAPRARQPGVALLHAPPDLQRRLVSLRLGAAPAARRA